MFSGAERQNEDDEEEQKKPRSRAAHRNRTSRDGRIRSTVTVPVPFELNLIFETDGGRDGKHPSNPVKKQPSTALDGIEREYPNELHFVIKPLLFTWPHQDVQGILLSS